MIKYICTNDLLYIPSLNARLHASDAAFNEALSICKKKNSTEEDLSWLFPILKYSSERISYEYAENYNTIEVFFNGNYYLLPQDMTNRYKTYFHKGSHFKPEYFANFLIKVLSNPDFTKTSLFERLEHLFYSFTDDGDIYVYKKYNKKDVEFEKTNDLALICPYNTEGKLTIIKVDPFLISSDFLVHGYTVGSCVGISTRPLINEYIHVENFKLGFDSFNHSFSAFETHFDLNSLDQDLINYLKNFRYEEEPDLLPKDYQILNIICR